MKKRLLAMLLSALMVANISACSDVSDGASKKGTEQTMQATIERQTSTLPQEESQNNHPDILLPPPVLENYSDILNEYKNLLIYEQEHGLNGIGYPSQKGEPTEIWETFPAFWILPDPVTAISMITVTIPLSDSGDGMDAI